MKHYSDWLQENHPDLDEGRLKNLLTYGLMGLGSLGGMQQAQAQEKPAAVSQLDQIKGKTTRDSQGHKVQVDPNGILTWGDGFSVKPSQVKSAPNRLAATMLVSYPEDMKMNPDDAKQRCIDAFCVLGKQCPDQSWSAKWNLVRPMTIENGKETYEISVVAQRAPQRYAPVRTVARKATPQKAQQPQKAPAPETPWYNTLHKPLFPK